LERVYAFTDEYGSFGWDLGNPNVTNVFVIGSIIVKEGDLDTLREQVESVRKKHFQTGEMKSSGIGSNHERRKRVIADLLPLPFSIFAVVFNLEEMTDFKGLRYKKSFYKFVNNIVHRELIKAFRLLTVAADEIGGSEYMQSFSKYVIDNQDIPNLLCEADFYFENSSNDVLIQLADLISGTLGHLYDSNKQKKEIPNYQNILSKKIIRVEFYPKTYKNYVVTSGSKVSDYDTEIAQLCFRQAVSYVENHKDDDSPEECARVSTVNYLLFKFMNNDSSTYISTFELKNQLLSLEVGKVSTHFFRTKIIAKLRDAGVIIASSKTGYRLPTSQAELFDFINIGTTIIMPMLERLKKCRDLIKMGTANHIDLFDQSEYQTLQKYFDEKPRDIFTYNSDERK